LERPVRIALVFPLLEGIGGSERPTLDMYRAREISAMRSNLYTARLNERAWEVLAGGMDNIRGQLFSGSR